MLAHLEGRQLLLHSAGLASAIEPCPVDELAGLTRTVPSHSIQLLVGIDAPTLRDLLDIASDDAEVPTARPIIFLDLHEPLLRAATIVERAIGQLARVAENLWPFWFGGQDFSEQRDDAMSHMHLPIRLAAVVARMPELSAAWAQKAIRKAAGGRLPRVASAAPETEWSRLCHAISPGGLILVVTLEDSTPRCAQPTVHALEWLATKGDVAIVVVTQCLPPQVSPFDHLLFGARVVALHQGTSVRTEPLSGNDGRSAEGLSGILCARPG